jgi:hypothetical protein
LLLLFIGDLAQQTVKDCLARRAEVDHVAHVANQIAQQRDHAAIAVVEKPDERVYGQTSAVQSLDVRYLARIPLGTPDAEIVARMQRILWHESLRGQCALEVDSTGVGAPVVEMLRTAGLGCEISAVTITGGEREPQNWSFVGVTKWSVPKQDLIAGVKVLVEKGLIESRFHVYGR